MVPGANMWQNRIFSHIENVNNLTHKITFNAHRNKVACILALTYYICTILAWFYNLLCYLPLQRCNHPVWSSCQKVTILNFVQKHIICHNYPNIWIKGPKFYMVFFGHLTSYQTEFEPNRRNFVKRWPSVVTVWSPVSESDS